jgi:hypothetical protein
MNVALALVKQGESDIINDATHMSWLRLTGPVPGPGYG